MRTEPNQTFPQEPILVASPITGQVLNLQPLVQLLHERYENDCANAAEDLGDVISYITREPRADEPAREVLAHIRNLNAFLVAFDQVRVFKTEVVG